MAPISNAQTQGAHMITASILIAFFAIGGMLHQAWMLSRDPGELQPVPIRRS